VVTAARQDVTSGWLSTSRGRVVTTVTRSMDYRNDDTVTDGGLTQSIRQADRGTQTVASTGSPTTRHSYDYPLTVDYSAAQYVDDQNFSLTGTVDMTMTLSDSVAHGRAWLPVAGSTETVDSTGILARTAGVTSQSDGSSRSWFLGTDDRHHLYARTISTNHGLITHDSQP
jgi:hypothetical protein